VAAAAAHAQRARRVLVVWHLLAQPAHRRRLAAGALPERAGLRLVLRVGLRLARRRHVHALVHRLRRAAPPRQRPLVRRVAAPLRPTTATTAAAASDGLLVALARARRLRVRARRAAVRVLLSGRAHRAIAVLRCASSSRRRASQRRRRLRRRLDRRVGHHVYPRVRLLALLAHQQLLVVQLAAAQPGRRRARAIHVAAVGGRRRERRRRHQRHVGRGAQRVQLVLDGLSGVVVLARDGRRLAPLELAQLHAHLAQLVDPALDPLGLLVLLAHHGPLLLHRQLLQQRDDTAVHHGVAVGLGRRRRRRRLQRRGRLSGRGVDAADRARA